MDLLESQAASRVQELVPIRYGRMLVSPFTFFRGAALIMASDLSTTPRSGLNVQACGDAHMSNFGVFASAERNLVFDLNDFDETLPGPWEWDVKRLAASLAIAGRDRGFSDRERASIVLEAVSGYRKQMATLAATRDLDVWYTRMDIEPVLNELGDELGLNKSKTADRTLSKVKARADKQLVKARTRDSMQALEKLTEVVEGETRFVSDPPLIVPISELLPEAEGALLTDRMHALLLSYSGTLQSDRRHLLSQFRFVSIARKVVGVGSVGTRAWVLLLVGSDGTDPLLLQAKEAQESVLARFVGNSVHANQGERVVAGQHLMQASSDIFLGWDRVEGIDGVQRDFYIRQLRDWKGSVDTDVMVPPSDGHLRPALWLDPGPGACPIWRPDRHRRVSRFGQSLRQCHCHFRGGLCRPERTRLRRTQAGGLPGTDCGGVRPVRVPSCRSAFQLRLSSQREEADMCRAANETK